MKMVKEIKKIGIVSKDVYTYYIYRLGEMSFIAKCNDKPIQHVFSSMEEAEEFIMCFPEF